MAESELTAPAENAAGTETACVRLARVYDWVVLQGAQNVQADIPAADLTAVLAAVAAGHALTAAVSLYLAASTVQVASIRRTSDCRACVTFRKLIASTVTIYDQTAAATLSAFSKTVQLFDSSDLCFPLGLPDSAISVRISGGVAEALSAVPFEGQIALGYTVCQEVTVTLDIFARVQILSYCASRQGAPCRAAIACPAAGAQDFPAACPAAELS